MQWVIIQVRESSKEVLTQLNCKQYLINRLEQTQFVNWSSECPRSGQQLRRPDQTITDWISFQDSSKRPRVSGTGIVHNENDVINVQIF